MECVISSSCRWGFYSPATDRVYCSQIPSWSEILAKIQARSETTWERRDEWVKETRRTSIVFPEPDNFEPLPQPAPFDLKSRDGKRWLQVVVKLASVHLTPEKPEYEGEHGMSRDKWFVFF